VTPRDASIKRRSQGSFTLITFVREYVRVRETDRGEGGKRGGGRGGERDARQTTTGRGGGVPRATALKTSPRTRGRGLAVAGRLPLLPLLLLGSI
jgi:hypothetical protein